MTKDDLIKKIEELGYHMVVTTSEEVRRRYYLQLKECLELLKGVLKNE